MEKYKLCPFCGAKNNPTALECVNCDADISRVRVTDDETQEAQKAPENPVGAFVRICEECGHRNPANARKCQNCGEDISHITHTADAEEQPKHYSLVALDGDYEWELCCGKTTVGRENSMQEYLEDKTYVGRAHAIFTLEDGKLTFENLKAVNFSYVNNTKIVAQRVELHDGDEVALGGNTKDGKRQALAAYFKVVIK